MGTGYSIKIAALPTSVTQMQVQQHIDSVLARVDRSMSGYRPDSEIARFNAAVTTDWVEVSTELATVVAAAQQVSEQSGGVLDITVAPLVNLWGFGPAGPRADVPAPAEVAAARAHVGFHKLEVRRAPPALRKQDPALTVDLNAVAPGYAVDLVAEDFTRLGLANFMIDIGGEVRTRGRNDHGRAWRIAVEKPLDGEPQPYAVVELSGESVTTSGEYRHYEMRAGQRVSHTIDPRTGRPVEHDLAAVVVISPTALQADAFATALNVLGEADGYELAMRRDLAALFLTWRAGQLHRRITPRFEKYFAGEVADGRRDRQVAPSRAATVPGSW